MLARRLLLGAVAGATGTAVLNLTTYLDMAIRARPSSQMPAEAADELTDKVGLPLAGEDDGDEAAQARKTALGALFGFATGIGLGASFGALRPALRSVPTSVLAAGVGLSATVASSGPLVALGLTDPTEWGAEGWVSDLVPHLAYGLATVLVHDALDLE
ncbi:MAG TPA: hypothetical protein VM324_00915 [Egibacteraceae bacterium]|jgi:hypothetical protein|nr:hypothetical protein [Egibacteraceae bacterium]